MDAAPNVPKRETERVLSLRSFGVSFGDQTVLKDINLDVGRLGATVVIGHGGAGKSTLVRSLAGYNHAQPAFRMWGEALYLGRPLPGETAPVAVTQSARLLVATVLENLCLGLPARHLQAPTVQRACVSDYLEGLGLSRLVSAFDTSVVELPLRDQRIIAVVRTVLAAPAVIMVDEPTAGLDDVDREAVIDVLLREARQRAVLCVTHNRRDAIDFADTTVLLVRGRIVEVTPTREFFAAPRSAAGRRWVDTGSCYMTREEMGTPTTRPPVAIAQGTPRGFHWIWGGSLAGMPRPGLLDDVEVNLSQLRELGISVVLGLEEEPVVPVGMFAAFGIEWFWLPTPDMGVPTDDDAYKMTGRMLEEIGRGRAVAVHCRAGLGRTGTMLAAILIRSGLCAVDALEQVRRVQPRFVQSEAQTTFLEQFDQCVRRRSELAPIHNQVTP